MEINDLEEIKEIFACLKDNEEAHKIVNECIIKIGERLKDIEDAIQELPTPDKTYYKPKGAEDYLTLKQNLDNIYERLDKLENGM
ncbi:hypothetical protein RW03080701_079 [Synechococcus phage S-RIM8]|uniref:Uncharacterized protein n=1 Tax=Synechococcus phage S-RIM8 TaxID=756278 RepID=A0A1D7SA03_9CAUD|nr:hypothetical protein RW03080701_079 [Synechococcus phage S-RIM8]